MLEQPPTRKSTPRIHQTKCPAPVQTQTNPRSAPRINPHLSSAHSAFRRRVRKRDRRRHLPRRRLPPPIGGDSPLSFPSAAWRCQQNSRLTWERAKWHNSRRRKRTKMRLCPFHLLFRYYGGLFRKWRKRKTGMRKPTARPLLRPRRNWGTRKRRRSAMSGRSWIPLGLCPEFSPPTSPLWAKQGRFLWRYENCWRTRAPERFCPVCLAHSDFLLLKRRNLSPKGNGIVLFTRSDGRDAGRNLSPKRDGVVRTCKIVSAGISPKRLTCRLCLTCRPK